MIIKRLLFLTFGEVLLTARPCNLGGYFGLIVRRYSRFAVIRALTFQFDAVFRTGRSISRYGRRRGGASEKFANRQLQLGSLQRRQALRGIPDVLDLGRDRQILRL